MLTVVKLLKILLFGIAGFAVLIFSELFTALEKYFTSAEAVSLLSDIRYLVVTLLILLLLYAFSWRRKKEVAVYGLAPTPKRLKQWLLGIAIGAPTLFIAAAIRIYNTGLTMQWNWTCGITLLLLYICGAFFQTFSEEMWFRTYIPYKLRQLFSARIAALVVGLIFGLLHLVHPDFTFVGVINGILIGGLLTYMYFDTGSIWICAGWHFGWNFFLGLINSKVFVTLSFAGIPRRISDIECGWPLTLLLLITCFMWSTIRKSRFIK
ncbi:MAG: CPBP family intramembrane glutamic endopeptidase [Negativicutes bacterium]|jgi:hypothetical protein